MNGYSAALLESTERGGVEIVVLDGDVLDVTCAGSLLTDELDELHRGVVVQISDDRTAQVLLVPVDGTGEEITGVRWDPADQLYYPAARVSSGTPASLTLSELQQTCGVPVRLVDPGMYLVAYHRARRAGQRDPHLDDDLVAVRDPRRRAGWVSQHAGTVRALKVLVELAYLGTLDDLGDCLAEVADGAVLDLITLTELFEVSDAGELADRLRPLCGLSTTG